jgi:hypothetical protein
MTTTEIIAAAGGINNLGSPRNPERLWQMLGSGCESICLFGQDRRTRAGEIRLFPSDAGGLYRDDEGRFWLLSPEELESIARG